MSGFDENPFGEPVFNDPFKVRLRKVTKLFHIFQFSLCFSLSYLDYLRWLTPTQDPSIQQVARNTANNNQNLDDYDPFSGQPATQQPATLQTSNQTLPAYTSSGQQYQVNDGSTNLAGSGVTQISTAELQVSHRDGDFIYFFVVCRNFHFWISIFWCCAKKSFHAFAMLTGITGKTIRRAPPSPPNHQMTHLTFKTSFFSPTYFSDDKRSWSEKRRNSSGAKRSFWGTATRPACDGTIGRRCPISFACSPASTTTSTSTSRRSSRSSCKTFITCGSSTRASWPSTWSPRCSCCSFAAPSRRSFSPSFTVFCFRRHRSSAGWWTV